MNIFKKNYQHIVPILVFFIFTIALTALVLVNIETHIPGGYGDAIQNITYLKSVTNDLNRSGLSNLNTYTNYLFENVQDVLNIYFWTPILSLLFGEIVAYNIVWFMSFFLASVTMYFLGYYLTNNRQASFLMGVLYSFAPYHFAYGAGFMGAVHVELIPLYFLALLLLIDRLSVKRFIFYILSFGALATTEHHYAYYALLLSVPVFIFFILLRSQKEKIDKGELFGYGAMLAVGVLSTLFLFRGMINVAFSGANYLEVGILEQVTRSHDFFHFFIPGNNHFIFGKVISESIWPMLSETGDYPKHYSEVSGYIGLSALAVIILTFIFFRKTLKDKRVMFWLVVSLVIFILSMGPFLSLLGPIDPKIPLPGFLLYRYLPFYENIRAVGRWFPFAFTGFAIVFGYALKVILNSVSPKKANLVILLLTCILLIELGNVPVISKVVVPDFVIQLKNQKEDFSVLNINSAYCYVCESQFRFYNEHHKKKAFGGREFARGKPSRFFEKNTPVFKEILYDFVLGFGDQSSVIKYDLETFSNHILAENNVRYLIFDKTWLIPANSTQEYPDAFTTTSQYISLNENLNESIDLEKYVDNNNFLVYRVVKPLGEKDYVLLRQPHDAQNIFVKNLQTGEEYIPFSNNNTLQLENYSSDDVYVKMQMSASIDGPVQIGYGGKSYTFNLTPTRRWYGLVLPKADNVVEKVEFRMPDNVDVQMHSLYYEKKADIFAHESAKKGEGDISVVNYDDSLGLGYGSVEPERIFVNAQEAILNGVLDWEAIQRDRDVYTSDYFLSQLFVQLRSRGIETITFEKFNDLFTEAYSNFVQIDLGMFSIQEDVGRFVIYGLNNLEDIYAAERLNAPFVTFLSGVGPLQNSADGLEGQSIYSYRFVEPAFTLGSNGEGDETDLSFELYTSQFTESLDAYTIEIIDNGGNRIRTIPFSRKVEIDVLGNNFYFVIKDQNGDIAVFDDGESVALYNLDLKQK